MFKSIISFMFIHLVSRIAVPKKNYKTIALFFVIYVLSRFCVLRFLIMVNISIATITNLKHLRIDKTVIFLSHRRPVGKHLKCKLLC